MPKRTRSNSGPPNPSAKRSRRLARTHAEYKSIDVTGSQTTVDSTGSVTLLNGCARGSDIGEREGREIMMNSLQMRLVVATNSTCISDQTSRVIIIYDKQSNGVAPSVADVLSPLSVCGMRNLENRKRFRILMDKTFSLNANHDGSNNVYTASDNSHFYDLYQRFSLPVTFNSGNSGTVADIATGSLYMVRIGSAAAGNGASYCSFCSRVRFTDK